MSYVVTFSRTALRDLREIPQRTVPAIVEFTFGVLQASPERAGSALQAPLEGFYGAHRGSYRILYLIDENKKLVRIDRIADRPDYLSIAGAQ